MKTGQRGRVLRKVEVFGTEPYLLSGSIGVGSASVIKCFCLFELVLEEVVPSGRDARANYLKYNASKGVIPVEGCIKVLFTSSIAIRCSSQV
eukprot:2144855-Rhodomonas_salina.2